MQVRYRHVFTVVVEGTDSFDDDTPMSKVNEYGDRDARAIVMLVKREGTDPKPVRSSRRTTTHVEFPTGDT